MRFIMLEGIIARLLRYWDYDNFFLDSSKEMDLNFTLIMFL